MGSCLLLCKNICNSMPSFFIILIFYELLKEPHFSQGCELTILKFVYMCTGIEKIITDGGNQVS